MFVALDLPPRVRSELAEWRDALVEGRTDLRPVAPEALHRLYADFTREVLRLAEVDPPEPGPDDRGRRRFARRLSRNGLGGRAERP